MTRAERSPVRRVVGNYVVAISGEGVSIRPLRSRTNGPAHKGITASALYVQLCWRDGARRKPKKVSRNLLRRDG